MLKLTLYDDKQKYNGIILKIVILAFAVQKENKLCPNFIMYSSKLKIVSILLNIQDKINSSINAKFYYQRIKQRVKYFTFAFRLKPQEVMDMSEKNTLLPKNFSENTDTSIYTRRPQQPPLIVPPTRAPPTKIVQ